MARKSIRPFFRNFPTTRSIRVCRTRPWRFLKKPGAGRRWRRRRVRLCRRANGASVICLTLHPVAIFGCRCGADAGVSLFGHGVGGWRWRRLGACWPGDLVSRGLAGHVYRLETGTPGWGCQLWRSFGHGHRPPLDESALRGCDGPIYFFRRRGGLSRRGVLFTHFVATWFGVAPFWRLGTSAPTHLI